MRHPREDYNERVQDAAAKIPAGEPVYLLRGQDVAAPVAVRAWAKEHLRRGGDPAFAKSALLHALEMERWQIERVCKLADVPVVASPRVIETDVEEEC